MNRHVLSLVSLSLLTSALACSGSSNGTGGLTCDLPVAPADGFGATHICAFYPNGTKSGSCPSGSNEVSSCSTSNTLGTCSVGNMTETFYSDGGLTVSGAEQVCSSDNGTWSR